MSAYYLRITGLNLSLSLCNMVELGKVVVLPEDFSACLSVIDNSTVFSYWKHVLIGIVVDLSYYDLFYLFVAHQTPFR